MQRTIIEKLASWKQNDRRKPLILKGCRQIGKTHSLLEFAKLKFEKYYYLNFEEVKSLKRLFGDDLRPKTIINNINLEFNTTINIEKDLLILDEIQDCPRALTSLKYFCESMPELAICSAGSMLGVHLNEFSFPVGKVDELDMHPMSFLEFVKASGNDLLYDLLTKLTIKDSIPEIAHEQLWKLLKIFFIVGGLPEVVDLYIQNQEDQYTAFKLVRERQNRLINNYVSDMAKHAGKENAVHLEALWSQIPIQLATTYNGSAAKFKFKGVVPEKDRYSRLSGTIDWLEAAGLIIRIPILHKANKPLKAYSKENTFKLCIFDVGILGALSGLDPKDILNYDYGTYKGFFAENFVAQEFLYSQSISEQLFSWKENNSELEFIRSIDGEIYPIEVKSGKVIKSQSLSIFAEKYKVPYKTIMSSRNLSIEPKINLHKYPLYLASRFPLKN